MYRASETMAERLLSAKTALNNALADEYVRNVMNEMGFTEARLNAGLALLQNVETLYLKQKQGYTEQFLASEALQKAWDDAMVDFKKYATAGKLSLMDNATLKGSLGLNERRKFSVSQWIALARVFYTTALQSSDVLAKLAEYSVTQEKLQAGLQLVEQIEVMKGKRDIDASEAQQASRERDKAFEKLDRYMYQFRKVARLVMGEKNEYLEKIGIMKRSSPIRKKKPVVPPPVVVSEPGPVGSQEITGE